MPPAAEQVSRARREALRLARETRDLVERHRRRLGPAAAELEAAVGELETAAGSEDDAALAEASRQLAALWEEHLAFTRWSALRDYGQVIAVAVAIALVVRGSVVEPFKIPSGSMVPTLYAGDHIFVSKLAYGVRVPFTRWRILDRAPPRRGDVIVFVHPNDPTKDYIKRVVGVAGDRVELRDQVVYVNGVPQPRTPAGTVTYEEQDGAGRWWSDSCARFVERVARGAIAEPPGELAAVLEVGWETAARAGVSAYPVIQCRRARVGEREGPFVVRPGHLFVLGDNRDRSADSRSQGGWQVPVGYVKGRATLVWWSWGRSGFSPTGDEGVRLDRLFKRIE